MNDTSAFDAWAPAGAGWSRWVKPVLFATARNSPNVRATLPPNFALERAWISPPAPDVATYRDAAGSAMAVVAELPGEDAVRAGLALARLGFRPVPLFNALPASGEMVAAVDVNPIVRALVATAPALSALALGPDAPPAFLLDAQRRGDVPPTALHFDNRSYCSAADFPSAGELVRRGISRVVLLRENAESPVAADLKPVLHAFQRAGLTIFAASSRSGQGPMSMTLRAPSIVARAVEWMYRVTVSKGDEEAFGRTVAHVG